MNEGVINRGKLVGAFMPASPGVSITIGVNEYQTCLTSTISASFFSSDWIVFDRSFLSKIARLRKTG